MKKFLVPALLLPLSLFAQKKLSINCTLTGMPEGSQVVLVDLNKVADTLGRAVVKNHAFQMTTQLVEPTLSSLAFADGNRVTLFLDNSRVTITGQLSKASSIKVKGSPTHSAFDVFQKKFNPLFEKIGKYNQQMQQYGPADSLRTGLLNTRQQVEKEIESFIKTYRNSAVSSFLLAITYQLTDDIFRTEQRYNSLLASAKDNLYAKYLETTINDGKVLAIGTPALEFTQADTLGNPVALSSFRGKYVLLDFWASWCGPCRQENPNVVQAFNRFKDKNFTVVGVSLDRPGQKEKWLQAIHADNLTWTHVSDLQFWNNAVAVQYKVQSIPQNFLIGPDGKIVAKNLRGPALESKLCELLGCN